LNVIIDSAQLDFFSKVSDIMSQADVYSEQQFINFMKSQLLIIYFYTDSDWSHWQWMAATVKAVGLQFTWRFLFSFNVPLVLVWLVYLGHAVYILDSICFFSCL